MKKFYIFALVAAMFAACATDATEDVAIGVPETLRASFEESDSRIQLANGKTVWTKGDQVSVFYRSNANQKWQYKGETGERVGELQQVDAGSATREMDRVVVVYPYNESYYINPSTCNVQASLPAVQTYLADSYGLNGNIMVSHGEYNNISLKSVCGWLKLQLTGNGEKVQTITLKGNNGEQVAGELYINSADATAILSSDAGDADDGELGGAGGNLLLENTILNEVTLNCGEGVTLGAEPTAFYIALPPQEFSKGLTVEIKDSNSLKMMKSTDKAISIERNHIQPMATIAYEGDFDKSEYCLTTEFEVYEDRLSIGYYNHLPAGKDNCLVNIDYGDGSFGKDESHTYATAGRYTVKFYFEKQIAEIATGAFMMTSLRNIIIPASVKVICKSAFTNSSLESIAFEANDTLKQIELSAFGNCHYLQQIDIPASVEYIADGAFAGCMNLTDINIIGNGNTPYRVYLLGKGYVLCTYIGNKLNYVAYTAGVVDSTELSAYAGAIDISFAAFYKCPYISSVHIIWIDTIADTNFADCDNLRDINISQTTRIGSYVLNNCPKLQTIDAPVATFVGVDSFCNNKSLTSISLGSDELCEINGIGNNNESLQTIHIPLGVTEITDSFNSDVMLAEIYCKATTPPSLINSFDSVNTLTVYVPAESVLAYKSTNGWSKYTIVGYDFENGVVVPGQPNNEIWYTSSDEAVVEPYESDVFGATIVSNTYENGKGVLQFDGDVTMIGENAFYECNGLTRIIIPNSVTSIGERAFYNCNSLTSVTIPDSVTSIGISAFKHCDSLTSITIPDSVTEIGMDLFYGCTSLTSVTIGDSVTSIESSTFSGCTSLTSVTIPNSVTSIGGYAFSGCSSLTSLTIPNSVTSIEDGAFNVCSSLKSIILPDSLTRISTCAFDGCSSLESVTIPDAVTSIGVYAFLDCSSLESVVIGSNVTSIGGSAFIGCSNLKSVYISDLSAWCKISFGYWTFSNPLRNGAKLYLNNIEVTELSIPSDITEIKDYTFEGCKSITSLTIPDSITSIGECAFFDCSNLKSVTLGNRVTLIGKDAFNSCSSLESITIPDSVTSIGGHAFNNCFSLKDVYCKAATPPSGGSDMFYDNIVDRKIYVPRASVDAYKAAEYWSSYKSYIEPYDFE